MRTRLLFLSAVALTLTYAACSKISESLERDVIIKPDTLLFNIPLLPTTTAAVSTGDLAFTLNLQNELDKQKQGLKISNIYNTKITSFKIDIIKDTSDKVNSFGNIDTLSVLLSNASAVDTLAKVINPSSATLLSWTLPTRLTGSALQNILAAPPLKYRIRFKARTATTLPMKARIIAVYTLQLKQD